MGGALLKASRPDGLSQIVGTATERLAGSIPVLERILREHMELQGLVRALRAGAAAGEITPEALRTLGNLLRDHVRLEECELFEAIERIVPAAELERVRL